MIQTHTPTKTAPTVWGLSPRQLHERFWASRGVQVVCCGEDEPIVDDAELFLLTSPGMFLLFDLRPSAELLGWDDFDVVWLRLRSAPADDYREQVTLDSDGQFTGFQRLYGGGNEHYPRVALTPHRELAAAWQSATSAARARRTLRSHTQSVRRAAQKIEGRSYLLDVEQQVMRFLRDLVRSWHYPDATIEGVHRISASVWADSESTGALRTQFVGPAWIGSGRSLEPDDTVVGPAVLWDDPASSRHHDQLQWEALEPTTAARTAAVRVHPNSPYLIAKRAFDIVASLLILALVWPVFPIVAMLIYLEDGRPIFFAHRRETRGGKPFNCYKFRSMRVNAEQIKAKLAKDNQADGPQFFIKRDPRLTRIGPFIRRFHIDELPQLFNILAGHMSLVGPRPSPFEENQYCPAWREARLSVKPGLTGLWQVMRTRREGEDFQEWIKYDIEYVEKASLKLDLWIIWRTLGVVVKGK